MSAAAPLPAITLARGASARAPDARTLRVAAAVRGLLQALELDTTDPNLAGTDLRVARAYCELFSGHYGREPRLRTFPNENRYAEPVALTGMSFYSVCAHHLLPFFGVVHIAYLPGARVLGLSKLARVVEHFARRPQLQERMTQDILQFLFRRLRPGGIMVVVQARHLCMEMRGVRRTGALTTTVAVCGAFAGQRLRRAFMETIALSRNTGEAGAAVSSRRERRRRCLPTTT